MSILIIDTSYYQKPSDINYDELYAGVDGVIGRIGYGTGATGRFVGKDPAWERTYAEAKARGIPIGGYHYVVEYRTVDDQLDVVRGALQGKTLELGFWPDIELESGAPALTRATVIEYVTKAKPLIGTGGIYTARWTWNPIMGTSNNPFSDMKLWVAAYTAGSPPLPYGWSEYWLWQYTSSGRLNGYAGNLDMNRMTDEKWKQWIGATLPPEYAEPLDVPLFSQRDSRWASDKLGTSSVTIGGYGCLITAASMVCKFYGKDTDPKRMNQALLGVNGYVNGNLLSYNAITDIYPDIVVDWEQFIANPTSAQIDAVLERGMPVIIQVDYNPATSALDQHWVVVIGRDSNGFLIADPIDGQVVNLSRYANKAFKMVVYTRQTAEDVLFKARTKVDLNVRSTPVYYADNRNVVDLLRKGDIVNVNEVHPDNGWFRIGVGRWCSGHEKYIERLTDPEPPALTVEERLTRIEKHLGLE